MSLVVGLIVLWIVSLCAHEYAHARVAYAGGDYTVADKGYLTFNPLKYVHPVMSILIPVVILLMGGIALPGGAVYIRTDLLRNRHWNALVSLAGPLANLALLLLVGLVFRAGWMPGMSDHPIGTPALTFALFGFFMAFAFLLNMLPVPGLDGFGIIEAYLPDDAKRAVQKLGFWPILILLGIMFRAPHLLTPVYESIQWLTFDLAGIPRSVFIEGFRTFQETLGRG